MATYLVRFLLSLSILISSGYSSIYASIESENTIDSYSGTFESSLGVNNTRQHPLSYSTAKEHGNDIFTINNSKIEEEEEEDELINRYKFLDAHYFNALYFTRIFGFLFDDLAEDIHFSKFIPDASTLRIHVLIQVFII